MIAPNLRGNSAMPAFNSSPLAARSTRDAGFTLLELMVALMMTLIITGAMFGLVTSSQGSFRREPALIERQQQIRIAMNRIEGDVLGGGMGLGSYFQTFAGNGNAVGVAGAGGAAQTGVRVAGDALLGGGFPDLLEVRSQDLDCPPLRGTRVGVASVNFDLDASDVPYPACFAPPSYVLAFYPTGAAKFALITHDPSGEKMQFAPGLNRVLASESQYDSSNNIDCDRDLPTPASTCAGVGGTTVEPDRFAKFNRILYRLGLDTDGVPSLFRSATGGYDNISGAFNTLPPGPAWQVVARGIEDMQVRYRIADAAGNPVWQNTAPVIVPPSFDNVVREVEVTLWARSVGEANLQGQTLAAGNQVTAVRGSLITSIAPRAAQAALVQEIDPAKRWQ